MRRFLAYCPEEEPRIFRMLDLISRGAPGHGPVHLLLISAAELGFAWDGNECGWVRVSLPPLRMMSGPVQLFRSAILEAWRIHVFAELSERRGLLGVEFADFQGSLQLRTSSHLRERDKMLLRAIWQGQEGRCSLPFLWKRDGGSAPFSPSCTSESCPNLPHFCPLTVASGPDVCYGMVGCLGLVVLVRVTLGYFFWRLSLWSA